MEIINHLSNLANHYNALLRLTASCFNLTASQAYTIQNIPYSGISMSQLSKRLGLDNSTLTRNIQKLEGQGLINRTKNLKDQRVYIVQLTKNGTKIINEIDIRLNEINMSLLKNINVASQESLSDLLEQLSWSIDCLRELQ